MKVPILIALAIALALPAAWSWSHASQLSNSPYRKSKPSPFVLSVVPSQSEKEPIGRRISMAKTSPGSFYVILTNTSKEPQAAFESWNSWGYQAISFEVQAADGFKAVIARKQHDFTRNFPSTFIIPSGESMVYEVSLNDEWNATPPLPLADQTPIQTTLKAIYEVGPTPEAAKENVWIGHLESKTYTFKLRHW